MALRGAATQFVAVGTGGTILSSPDGISWTKQDGPEISLSGITWSGSQFVAVGNYGWILSSPDGRAWTQQFGGLNEGPLSGISWNGSQFVAVGFGGKILTSPDGISWTRQTFAKSHLYAVIWSGSQFVAVGWYGTILQSGPVNLQEQEIHFNYPLFGDWRLTRGFGERWSDTGTGTVYESALGEVYITAEGSPVLAVAGGTVVEVFPDGSNGQFLRWGNTVIIQHPLPDGATVFSQYSHLGSITVLPGQAVSLGEPIGTVGRIGDASTSQLYLQISSSGDVSGGYSGTRFAGMNTTHNGITYYHPRAFIELNREISEDATGWVVRTGGLGLRLRASPGMQGQIMRVVAEGEQVGMSGHLYFARGIIWGQISKFDNPVARGGALSKWPGRCASEIPGRMLRDRPWRLGEGRGTLVRAAVREAAV